MKAYSKLFLGIFGVLLLWCQVSASAEVTTFLTPETATLKWATKVGEGWQKNAGLPVIVEDGIAIMSGDELLLIDPGNGSIIKKTRMSQPQSYGYVPPTYVGDTIYANLSEGTVEAFDAKTLESRWVYTDPLGGKGMTKIVYSDNVIYTGFWNGETKDASFVAIDTTNGSLIWRKVIDGGLYWAGALCTNDFVVFPTDDGKDKVSYIVSCDKKTGEVISEVAIENKGDIRSSVIYDYATDKIFVTTKGGYLISAKLNAGVIENVSYGEIGSASTSTPVIYNQRIYIGAADKTLSVFDATTLSKLFAIPLNAYPQCTPLVSTGYEQSEGLLYIYTTYNKTPGGITLIKIPLDATDESEAIVTELYDAKGYEQYCISDIISDSNGTLYYKNDSGYLFALSDNGVTVRASLSESEFVFDPVELRILPSTAEDYGYADSIESEVSALDVLVKIHECLFGDKFSVDTAKNYLDVSAEGYLSRVVCIDTYNFGFAINGKAPHDDILTNYGYTGYSVNQAKVSNFDRVEFFLYRDSWAMDNYAHFEKDGEKISYASVNVGEELLLKLKGYTFGWYSCYEDSQIDQYTNEFSAAQVFILNENTDVIDVTDENGDIAITFDTVGKYIVSAKESNDDYPLISICLEIDVWGVQTTCDGKNLTLKSNLKEETEAKVIVCEFSDNVLNNVSVQTVILPKGFSIKSFRVPNNNIKAFIWNCCLQPLSEVSK